MNGRIIRGGGPAIRGGIRPPVLWPRNGRARIEPAQPPSVHPRAAPGQHRPAVVGDALRLSPRRGETAGDGMIIVMRHDATPAQVAAVVSQVELHGCRTHLSDGDERTVIGVIGTNPFALRELFIEAPGVAEVVPITKPFKLSNREFRARDTRIKVGAHEIGGGRPRARAPPRPGARRGGLPGTLPRTAPPRGPRPLATS